MKNKSNKLNKLEKGRYSIFSDRTDKCYFCGSDYQLTWHEIFDGRNRQNSMRYGLCLRICMKCHMKITNNIQLKKEWYKKGQVAFEETYPDLDFISIFYKNYL